MRRREFIAGLGSAEAWPAVARAQYRRAELRYDRLPALADVSSLLISAG
jgi:hypothetical protein